MDEATLAANGLTAGPATGGASAEQVQAQQEQQEYVGARRGIGGGPARRIVASPRP